MAKGSPTIAATSTLAMIRTAAARGVATADLLERAGITPTRLEDPDARLPAISVLALWQALRERTADPWLQLAAPAMLPFGAYHVIDYLVAASDTVGEGIRRFARFFTLIADAVALTVAADRRVHWLELAFADGRAVPAVYVDYVFAALVSRIRFRARPELQALRVELRQPQPPQAGPYRDLFRAPVHFGRTADRLYFSDAEWNAPMHGADAALARVLEEHARLLAQRMPPAAPGFNAEVQRAIAVVLPEGGSAADVARTLHMSVRTLQRRLMGNGTTFRQLYDAVRAQLAREYLRDRKVSIAEVAFLLGFSDQSSFNRTFRRWTGQSPGRWRRQEGEHELSASG